MQSLTTTLTRRLALTALLPLGTIAAGYAAPITGSGQPISDVQPSLGLNYIVQTIGTNLADIGEVDLFAGGFAPGGWASASGQSISIASNPVLFTQIGTTYGGNATTTFDLPNLNGRAAIGTARGAGLSIQTLGAASGSNTQTLTASQLPPFGGAGGVTIGSVPVPIRQPSLALNYGIVTQGVFPTIGGTQSVSGPIIGQIVTYAGGLPSGVLPADGQALPINQYSALFSILGTTFGGNGFTDFDLPDLQGRAPTSAGQAPGLVGETLGEKTGNQQVVLSTEQLPPNQLKLPNGGTGTVGGDQPFSIAQPSLALHAIIDVAGAFPTQTGQVTGGTPFLGETSWFAGDFAPAGWEFADGQLLSIAQNQALFSILGTIFGGNGVTTFALPDLADRLAVGMGDGITLGRVLGTATDTLTYAQLPVGYPPTLPAVTDVPEPACVALFALASVCLPVVNLRPRRRVRIAHKRPRIALPDSDQPPLRVPDVARQEWSGRPNDDSADGPPYLTP